MHPVLPADFFLGGGEGKITDMSKSSVSGPDAPKVTWAGGGGGGGGVWHNPGYSLGYTSYACRLPNPMATWNMIDVWSPSKHHLSTVVMWVMIYIKWLTLHSPFEYVLLSLTSFVCPLLSIVYSLSNVPAHIFIRVDHQLMLVDCPLIVNSWAFQLCYLNKI